MTTTTSTVATAERLTRCRYLRRNEAQCTAEAADPDAQILLCTKHLARAMALVTEHREAARRGGKKAIA